MHLPVQLSTGDLDNLPAVVVQAMRLVEKWDGEMQQEQQARNAKRQPAGARGGGGRMRRR